MSTTTNNLTGAGSGDPASVPWLDLPAPVPRTPLTTLTASAQRLVSKKLTGTTFKKPNAEWQEDAWEMFDLVGEQRFLATTLAGRMGQARFYVGELDPQSPDDTPERTEDVDVAGILESIGGNSTGLSQLVTRLAVNLFIAGDGWLVGVPKHLIPDVRRDEEDKHAEAMHTSVSDGLDLTDLEWKMLSVSEVDFKQGDEIDIHLGTTDDEKITTTADDVYLIRVWRPHPRKAWEADSPTRSSLPVLRELVGLTMHISAQVDSRLSGAGVLLVPQSAQQAMKEAAGQGEDDDDDNEDVFSDALMEAMMTPINDRSSAAAVVPLVTTVPDASVEHFRHISFASQLDAEARELRDEAIRRLALGQDAPPELLLGVGSMNHWGAWLVREDVVSTHLEPILALISDALTVQFLHPVLEEQGMAPEEAEKYVVWYDVSHMVSRPNRASDAQTLHGLGVISDEALRNASGFDDSDAPKATEEASQSVREQAVEAAIALVTSAPSLAREPGIRALVDEFEAIIRGEDAGGSVLDDAGDAVSDSEDGGADVPDTDEDDAPGGDAPPPSGLASRAGIPYSDSDSHVPRGGTSYGER